MLQGNNISFYAYIPTAHLQHLNLYAADILVSSADEQETPFFYAPASNWMTQTPGMPDSDPQIYF